MSINSPFISEGATKPSSLAVDSYEPYLSASRVTQIPPIQQTLIDYVGGSNPIYVGVAGMGFAQSSGTDNDPTKQNWLITKITWDGNNNPTSVQHGWGKWSDRVSTVTYS
jgi:hypothetical protein